MPEDTPTGRGQPMYASYLTFTTLLDWLHDMQHLPSQFDRSWWGSKFSGSGGAQLMAGLRFLGLLDKEAPTDALEQLAHASTQARAPLLAAILRDAYGADLVDGLTRMTPKMLGERIEAMGTTDGTHRKAMAFFVNAVKAAQLPIPAAIAKQARNRPAAGARRIKANGPLKKPIEQAPKPDAGNAVPPPVKGIHPALAPFLADLAAVGPTWDEVTYQRWKETFDQVLLYAYPVQDDEDEDGDGAEEEGQ
jgi:hypothetical protein